MATLEYGGVKLESIETLSYEVTPVTDPSGMDYECSKVSITVQGVWQDNAIGSNKGGFGLNAGPVNPNPGGQVWGMPGDRLGISLFNLREILMTPRQVLRYFVGNDLVVLSPQLKAEGTLYACDVKGGPFPQRKTMVKIIGDRAAWVRFSVETFVSQCSRYILSNRWETTQNTDEHGFTGVTYTGRAAFRKDFLVDENLVVDDFRQHLFLPCDPLMRRVGVNVNANREGTEVAYTVSDQLTNYGTGINSGITKIACNVTSGGQGAIKSPRDLIQQGAGFFGDFLGSAGGVAAGNAASAFAGVKGMVGKIGSWLVPHTVLAGICQIWGQPGADRFNMARVAHAMLANRLNKGRLAPVSLYVHVDWSSDAPPFVEITASYMGPLYFNAGLMSREDVLSPLNWNETIVSNPVPGVNFTFAPNTPRTQLPGATPNVRGYGVGRMVGQALSTTTCGLPARPVAVGGTLGNQIGEGPERTPYGLNTPTDRP